MIELPPGWIKNFRDAKDKAAFLRGWAETLEKRAEEMWSSDRFENGHWISAEEATERDRAELLEAAAAARAEADERERLADAVNRT